MDEGSIAHITVAHAGEAAEYGRAPGSVTWMVLGEKDVPVFNQKWSGTTLLLSGPRVDRVLDFSRAWRNTAWTRPRRWSV